MNRQPDGEFQDELENGTLRPDRDTAESIALLRTAVHSIRETQRPPLDEWLAPARKRRRAAQRRTVLAWACAAALCFAALPFSLRAPQPHPGAAAAVQTAEPTPALESDTALLEQVDTEIAEPVPSSLAPLTELDSWNSTTSTNASSFARTEKKNVTQ